MSSCTPPDQQFATKEAAILQALEESNTGDTVIIHDASCATMIDEACDCLPVIMAVQRGIA